MSQSRMLAVVVASFALAAHAVAQAPQLTQLKDVKVRFSKSTKDRVLVDKSADLQFDDERRTIVVKSAERPLNVRYDAVRKVVFDVSTHMRGGAMSQLLGGVAGAVIASQHVQDFWCYLEYAEPDGTLRPYMLEISKETSADVIAKMQALFGTNVTIAAFSEKEEKIEKDTLKDLQSKHDLKIDKKNHPLPEPKASQALLVVVASPLAARFSGKGVQMKFHANDRVVAVNKQGTYCFVYLDPGEYLLVSQSENGSGFRMTLEAGQEYYFLQNTLMGAWKARTTLSRNSKELVMYELSGANRSDWTRKK